MWITEESSTDWSSVERELKKLQYTIIKMVGEGGMGRAYAVRDKSRADKVVKITRMLDDCAWRNEFDYLEQVRHPNIASVYRCFKVCNMLVMEMHYYTGKDLHERLSKQPKEQITNDKMAPILRDILSGLIHIHDKKIVHRDLKPANILFNESESALITDFGLAALDTDNTLNLICGTTYYQAPEMLNNKMYGSAVDIFAVGVIVRAICGMNANHPPLFVYLGMVEPWVKGIYCMTSAVDPEKRRNAVIMYDSVDSALRLIRERLQLDQSTSTPSSSTSTNAAVYATKSAPPGLNISVADRCRWRGHAEPLLEGRRAERRMNADKKANSDCPKDPALRAAKNKSRNIRRRTSAGAGVSSDSSLYSAGTIG